MDIANAATRVRGLHDILGNINKVIFQKNETISKVENEIVKRNAVIEKKQGTIDQMNKRIDSTINKNGVSCALVILLPTYIGNFPWYYCLRNIIFFLLKQHIELYLSNNYAES